MITEQKNKLTKLNFVLEAQQEAYLNGKIKNEKRQKTAQEIAEETAALREAAIEHHM